MRTLRISHPAFFGIHSAATIRFYTEILGMRIVLRQPNLDDASMEHVFFHVGEDNFIAYFLPYDEAAAEGRYQRMKPVLSTTYLRKVTMIRHASIYEARERPLADGLRVLVMRRWPRGVRK